MTFPDRNSCKSVSTQGLRPFFNRSVLKVARMPVIQSLSFTRRQVQAFGKLFRSTRKFLGKTQLDVARKAFGYDRSHSKISRIERGINNKVDAFAVDRIARALNLPIDVITAIDPRFSDRLAVIKTATNHGFWTHRAYAVVERKVRAQPKRKSAPQAGKPAGAARGAAPVTAPALPRTSFTRDGGALAGSQPVAGRPSQAAGAVRAVGQSAAKQQVPTSQAAEPAFVVSRQLFVKPGRSARARG